VAGTGAVQAVTPTVIFRVVGVVGTGAVGTVTNTRSANIFPVGVVGTGAIGTIIRGGWTTIDDSQTPNWVDINVAA
jgi:hypothetical protein